MTWDEILNLGLPAKHELGLTVDLIGTNCATNQDEFVKIMISEVQELFDSLRNSFDIPINIKKVLITYTADMDFNGVLIFSPYMYLLSLLTYLNVPSVDFDYVNEKKLLDEARKRISILSRIKYESQLKTEFPLIYEIYENLKQKNEAYKDLRTKSDVLIKLNLMTQEDYDKKVNAYNKIFKHYGIEKHNFNIKSFVELFSKKCGATIKSETYDKLVKKIASLKIDINKFDNCLDKESFAFLLAASNMANALIDPEDAILSISYITEYFKKNIDTIDSEKRIELSMEGKEISLNKKELYEMYKKFLIEHPEVKLIHKTRDDFKDKTYDDLFDYIDSYSNELQVSWDILPASESLFTSERIKVNTLTDEEKTKKQESKERILKEKEDFFNENRPYLVLKGKNSFMGYIGYIYPNAYVVLEKFYKNNKGKTIAEDAIYIMKVEEFIELSVKSKPEIIDNHLCKRVTHHRGWQNKVSDFLKVEANEDTIDRVQIFENQIKHLNQ